MKSVMTKLAVSLVAAPVLSLAMLSHLNAQDTPAGAWAGTWKFNLEKSKFPGKPPAADQVGAALRPVTRGQQHHNTHPAR